MFDDFFELLSLVSGTPSDYVRLFLLFLLSYPLAIPLNFLSPTAKHAANIGVTTFYLYGILGLKLSYLQLLVNCLVTYELTRRNVGGKHNMPWIVFIFQMAHLTINHLVRSFGNIPLTTIEITAMQMVLCMNLTSFAWSVHDGKNKTADECDEQQRAHRITKFPSLLEFLGYAFYFPGVLIGPSTRFVDYRAWTTGELYKTKDRKPPPGRFLSAFAELGSGLGFMGVWMALSPIFFFEAFLLPIDHPRGSALRNGVFGRLIYAFFAGLAARSKYYGIWALANGSCIMSGLSFNGPRPDGSGYRWDRCKNIRVLGVEFANNWKELLDNWNMNTNVWLRNNVYKRVARPGKKPGFKSTMMTFMTSAFWHGVAPGYYFTFVLGGLLQSTGRSMRAHFRPFAFTNVRTPNPTVKTITQFSFVQLIYCTISVILLQLTMNFAAMPFILLEVRKSLQGWQALYFYGIFAAVLPIAAFSVGAGKALDELSGAADAKRAERAARDKAGKDAAASAKAAGKANGTHSAVTKDVGNPQIPDVDVVQDKAMKVGQEARQAVEQKIGGRE